jgi:hypothetical protein
VQANRDDKWVRERNEELYQIYKNKAWDLVPRPNDKNIIGSKWVYRNKLNEYGHKVKNRGILVCKGHAQVEGVEFKEFFSLIARIEAIMMFLDFACYKNFKVYHMDVKLVFLNGDLEEEVYVEKPEGFLLIDKKDFIC